jgi:phosphoribosylformimino-5-aminoimidazole carboxamide ribotide isomerase
MVRGGTEGAVAGVEVIPVVDIRNGLAVRARAGHRDAYRPIETPLAPSAEPLAVAEGLLAAVPARRLYIADLDAIEGRGANEILLQRLAAALRPVELWIDGGFATLGAARAVLEGRLGRPVLGSESQTDLEAVRALGDAGILSLDSRDGRPLGPPELHEDAALWPRDLILMTLARVGSAAGPDLDRIADARRRAPHCRLFAAGGLRGPEDLAPLTDAGAAGVLVASAIHDGRLRREHLG